MAATTLARRARGARARRVGAGLALAVLSAVAAAGCGGSDQADGASSPGGRASESRSPAQSAGSSSADRTASASPSASAEPSVSAADGNNVGACADGDCEIAVSSPVTVRFKGPGGPATLSVTEVGPGKVEYTVKSGNGQSKAGASGPGQGCITVLRSNGSGNSCGGLGDAARPSAQPDAVVIQVAAGADGTAIVHIVTD